MSGWKVSIWARLASQSGSSRASVGAVTGTIRRLSAGGRPRMLRSCRSVVITSEVAWHQVEPELLELLLGLGDVGDRAAADLELRLLALQDLLAELDGLLAAPELDLLLGEAQYCCSIDRTWAMTSALNRQTEASALSRAITIGARLASRPLS